MLEPLSNAKGDILGAGSERALYLFGVATGADDLREFAGQLGIRKFGEKLIARIWNRTYNGGARPCIRRVVHSDFYQRIDNTRIVEFAKREGELKTNARVRI